MAQGVPDVRRWRLVGRVVKPRLRWNGIIWARRDRLRDAWRYWRAWYETTIEWGVEARFYADHTAELLPL